MGGHAIIAKPMALLSLGYGCHRTRDFESFKWSRVYLGGHRLFHKVGGGTLYKSVTQAVVARFLKHNIICRYGMPREIIIDNGMNLNGKMIQ